MQIETIKTLEDFKSNEALFEKHCETGDFAFFTAHVFYKILLNDESEDELKMYLLRRAVSDMSLYSLANNKTVKWLPSKSENDEHWATRYQCLKFFAEFLKQQYRNEEWSICSREVVILRMESTRECKLVQELARQIFNSNKSDKLNDWQQAVKRLQSEAIPKLKKSLLGYAKELFLSSQLPATQLYQTVSKELEDQINSHQRRLDAPDTIAHGGRIQHSTNSQPLSNDKREELKHKKEALTNAYNWVCEQQSLVDSLSRLSEELDEEQ